MNKPQRRCSSAVRVSSRCVETLLDAGQAVDEARAVAHLGADTALEHHARNPVLPHRRGQALRGTSGVGVRVGQREIGRMHPEDRLGAASRIGHIVGVALVADGQLDVITHLSGETVPVTQQQPRTHTGTTEHAHDVRSDMSSRGGDSDRHGDLLSLRADQLKGRHPHH
jgi:hypothetical protein